MDLAHRRLTPDFVYIDYVFGRGIKFARCEICAFTALGFFVFYPGVFLSSIQSDWSMSCDHGLGYIYAS